MLSRANTILRHYLSGYPVIIKTVFPIIPRRTISTKKDEYFAQINHISNIVRSDITLERTLNRLDIKITNDLIYRVLRACNTHGVQSFRFFNWAKTHTYYNPTAYEYEELIRLLAKNHNWETMWKVICQLKPRNRSTYQAFLDKKKARFDGDKPLRVTRGVDYDKQLSVDGDKAARGTEEDRVARISGETVGYIIKEYGEKGCVDEAVTVFNLCGKVFNCEQTVGVYNDLLYALCRNKNLDGAYGLVRRMIKKGKKPDKHTFSVLVTAWCKAGKMREAQSFLVEMSDKGFKPPVPGRDLLVEGLLNAGSVESAKKLVLKMSREGFLPHIGTVNLLLQTICSYGELEECLSLFNDLFRLGVCPDHESYKIMIPVASRLDKIDEGFRLLHLAIEQGVKPFPSLYAPVLKALYREGRFDDAYSFFSDMKVKGHPPNRPVYTMVLRMCARGERFVDAANYLIEMTHRGLTPFSTSFGVVIDGLKNIGKHDLAKRIEGIELTFKRL